jgi:ribosomal protein S18 acetylase RimI-like enzyme
MKIDSNAKRHDDAVGMSVASAQEIPVRLIRESDLSAFKALRLEALRLHPYAFGMDFEEDSREPDSVWVERVRKAVSDPDSAIVVADAGTELAGMVGIWRNKGAKCRHAAGIWGVYVREQYRGQRLGQRMIEQALDRCRSRQIRIVRLAVADTNAAAIRCYERCGFAASGISREEIRVGDVYHDELLMSRKL